MERRDFLFSGISTALAASFSAPAVSASERPVDIRWSDLIPEGGGIQLERLRSLGVVEHGQYSTAFDQELSGAVTDEFNGQWVRIPGYLVPLEFTGTAMTSALLVPYVGACVHVPPPPPNQLIFLTTALPYESEGLFEPVQVTGILGTSVTETQLAEVGYSISADLIEPFE